MQHQPYVKPFVLFLLWTLLAPSLLSPVAAAPPAPDLPGLRAPGVHVRPQPPHPERAPLAGATTDPPPQTLCAEAVVAEANGVYTWTQDTQADWEQGVPDNLDSTIVSGTLQLEQRWFTENTTITPRDQLASGQMLPDVTADNAGNLYAVWVDRRETNSDLYFAQRPQGGTWSTNVRINDVPGSVPDYPDRTWSRAQSAITVDDSGNLYAVWIDERNGRQDVYFATRPSGGNWSANERVNDNTYSEIECETPEVVVATDGTVNVAWTDMRSGGRDVYWAMRSPAGIWSANVRINDDADRISQYWVSLGIDDADTLYAVWQDSRGDSAEIYFAQRPEGGDWARNEIAGDEPEGIGGRYKPKMTVTPAGNVYVVWEDYRLGETDIYFSERLSDGTWTPGVRVNQATYGWQERADVVVDDAGNVHVFWKDFNNGAWYGLRSSGLNLLHRYRSASDSSWSTVEVVNEQQCGTYCLGYVSDMYYGGYAVTFVSSQKSGGSL